MISCIDVHYHRNYAVSACVLFEKWNDPIPFSQIRTFVSDIAPYIPGQFYLRELPCILKALELINHNIEIIIVDGYVWLDDLNTLGLGAHLYNRLDKKISVIGVAKNRYKTSSSAIEIFRGKSKKPLYITSVGIDQELASQNIQNMHGENRIPTLLKKVDQISRDIE